VLSLIYDSASKFLSKFLRREPQPDRSLVSPFWFHAASVGEVFAASSLIRITKEKLGSERVFLTTMTSSGKEKASHLFEDVKTFLFPFDNKNWIRRVIDITKPVCLIILETELWPNLINEAKRVATPIFLVNGRLTMKSYKKYRLIKGVFSSILRAFTMIFALSEEEREKFILLGAPSQKVKIFDSLKFDSIEPKEKLKGRKELGIDEDKKVIVFGNVRGKEIKKIVDVTANLIRRFDDLSVFIVPRHLRRVGSLESYLKKKGIEYSKWSERKRSSIIVVDSIGELPQFYSICDLAFVGGTLHPYGGHSLIEPASYAKPVVFGPYFSNMREVAKGLIEEGGGIAVRDENLLEKTLTQLLREEKLRRKMGRNALNYVSSKRGVSSRLFNEICSYLDVPHS